MRDDRKGYINNAGVRGELRRDEDDRVANADAFVQASVDAERWSAIVGARASHVGFDTRDRYVAPGNPDDSGSRDYHAITPVAGLTWHAARELNVYANAGCGFETPTFTEIAYRNNASGLNTALNASRSTHVEAGAKWRVQGHLLDAAAFEIHTRDEIVGDTNVGGRSTFRNAGHTKRRGSRIG